MVEWKELGEVASYYRGVTYNKKQEVSLNSGGTKILRANNITLGTNSINYDDIKEIDSSVRIKNYQWLYPNDILICAGSGSKEHVGKVAFIDKQIGYAYGGFMGKIVTASSLNPRFLFHIICSSLFKDYLKVALNSTTINNLNAEIVNCFIIPIPSLSEQKRIVGILDTFTDSIENLKLQIAQRRKQYEHYREKLLTNVDMEDTNWKELSEIADLYKGTYVTKKESNEGAFPVVMGGQKVAYYIDKYNSEGESIVISRSGINAGYVSFWNQPIFVSDGYRIDTNEKIIKKYLFYFLKSREGQINSSKKGAGVPHIQSKYLLSILVPQPPLSDQQRIVSILDTFEASIANLEAQLEQRQKQYEYYRNKLLTFEKEEQ